MAFLNGIIKSIIFINQSAKECNVLVMHICINTDYFICKTPFAEINHKGSSDESYSNYGNCHFGLLLLSYKVIKLLGNKEFCDSVFGFNQFFFCSADGNADKTFSVLSENESGGDKY